MLRLTRIVAALTFIAATLVAASVQAASNQAGATQTYLVLYKGNAVVADAIGRAGGALVASYNQIGVAVARSSSATFAADVARDSRVEGAAPTARFASRLGDGADSDADAPAGNMPVSDSDNLSGRQWDMRQIHVPEAHAITGGSPA